MEINQKDLELELSRNVKKRYITQVKNNIYESSEFRELKLKRNWILGEIIKDTEISQSRSYGKLIMKVMKDNNTMTQLYNIHDPRYHGYKNFKNIKEDKQEVEKLLGIDKLREKNKSIYINGYKLSDRFYKTYIRENENNTYKNYEELLKESVEIIREGTLLRAWNDKEMYQVAKDNKYTIVTLTGNLEITNVRWGVINE